MPPTTNSPSPTRPRTVSRWGVALLLSVSVLVATFYLLGGRLVLLPAQRQAAALAQWQASAPPAYRVTLRVVEPLRRTEVYDITVSGGEVRAAYTLNDGLYRFSADPTRFPLGAMFAAPYTPNALHEQARRLAERLPPIGITWEGGSTLVYDRTWGYVSRYTENVCGLLFAQVETCITHYEVLRFEVLGEPDDA